MKTLKHIALGVGALMLTISSAYAADMKAPDDVRKALGTLARVVVHTQRLIDVKNYDRLPHEDGEFIEGAEALEKDIAAEPAGFKAKVGPLLKTAEANSHAVADAAKAHDDAKLTATHAAFDVSVKAVLAAFPDSVQPATPQ